MSALDALSAARAAGVKLTLDGDGVVLSTKRPPLPVDLVALLKANKPDIMKILEWREAAREALSAAPPSDCAEQFAPRVYGVRKPMWDLVQDGLRRFCAQGWGDKACLLGWTKDELYRVPSLWARVDLCGAGLLIGDKKVIAVTAKSIVVERLTSIETFVAMARGEDMRNSRTQFRRIGREHVA